MKSTNAKGAELAYWNSEGNLSGLMSRNSLAATRAVLLPRSSRPKRKRSSS